MKQLTTSVLQRPQDLVLAVLTHNTLPKMTYLQQATHSIGAWSFEFAIVGESHHVRVTYDGACIMNEILACVQFVDEQCTHFHAFRTLDAHDFESRNYRVEVSFEVRSPWQNPHPPYHQIQYQFPTTQGQMPITRIQWQQHENALNWWTLHTYAEKDKTTHIHTQSSFIYEGR
jgi:hypothetical protein